MKTLINHYYEETIADDMTQATNNYVAMSIALGIIADPDYRYELQGFTPAEVAEIKANVDHRMARMIPIDWDIQGAGDTHFLGDRIGEIAA